MKTIIVGFDAFDPEVFEKLHAAGKLPNLGKYVENGGYARFGVTDPPQSEVSWTSIATGLNPGGHGIFDFVHRNPENYVPNVSILLTKSSAVGTQFVPPHQATTIFEAAIQDGYQATSLWWPATFPARPEIPSRSIPGLGAPDVLGRLGVGILLTTDEQAKQEKRKTEVGLLTKRSEREYTGTLKGPSGKTLTGFKESAVEVSLSITGESSARLTLDKETIEMTVGEWSPIIEVVFKVGLGVTIRAITRVIINSLGSQPSVYFLPLQIHPLHSAWRYGTPKGFLKDLWKNAGPFLTLGWPQDTTGLEEGCITDDQFLTLCDQISADRERVFMHLLDKFDEGVLACVFDTLDRVQHMFWKDHPEEIEDWYLKLDALMGRIQKRVDSRKALKNARVLVVSDHGFKNFDYKVHLNRWLEKNGYLAVNDGAETGSLKSADWSQTKAYAIGLNSLYLNLAGREGQGGVTAAQKTAVVEELQAALLAWKGPDGRKVVQKVLTQQEAFDGPLAEYGPDFVIGYAPGYRASAETGLGEWETDEILENKDHWGADHCYAAESVPGVLFSSQSLGNLSEPTYRDFPQLAIGKTLTPKDAGKPPSYSDEDQEVLEERLRDLGYL